MLEGASDPIRPRPTWYAGPDSLGGEFWTMLHLPYTMMVLSFATIGAVLSPRLSLPLLAATLAAYFLGLGVGAHLLDQLPGMGSRYVRHWPRWALWTLGLAGVAGGVTIGVVGAILFLGPAFLVLVIAQGIAALGYPLAPVFRGVLHRDSVFAVSWGSLPFLTSFYAQSGMISAPAVAVAVAFAFVAVAEIRTSRLSRLLRRVGPHRVPGEAETSGSRLRFVRRAPDLILQLLVAGSGALALGLFFGRVIW